MLRKIREVLFGSAAPLPTPVAAPEPTPAPPICRETFEPPPRSSEMPKCSEWSPLVAATKKTPDLTGAVEVLPAGKHGGAPEFDPPRSHCIGNPSTGHVISATVMVPSEIAEYCRNNPIFVPKITPPEGVSFADRAMFWAVFYAISEWDRAKLYEKGGIALINATVLHAMDKLKSAQTPGVPVYRPEEEFARAKAEQEKCAAAVAEGKKLEEVLSDIDWKAEAKAMAEERRKLDADKATEPCEHIDLELIVEDKPAEPSTPVEDLPNNHI